MPGRLLRWERSHAPNQSENVVAAQSSPLKKFLQKADNDRRGSTEFLERRRYSMDHFKRTSIIGKIHGSDKKEIQRETNMPEISQVMKMDIQMESPPILFLGPASNSSAGFLMSAQLKLDVISDRVTINELEVELRETHHFAKPVVTNCADCHEFSNTLRTWRIFVEPRTLNSRKHFFPFSEVLPDHLPATTHGNIATLTYKLIARATLSTGKKITHSHELEMKRALPPSREPKHFKRIFPPTKLVAEAFFPQIIHPIGDFPVEFRLSGLVSPNRDGSVSRCRLRRLMWRIEQHETAHAPACPRHNSEKGGSSRESSKIRSHTDTRIIGHDELKSGWKTDYAAILPNPNTKPLTTTTTTEPDATLLGAVELDFHAHILNNLRPLCDVDSPSSSSSSSPAGSGGSGGGLHLTHSLVVELVIEDEWVPSRNPAAVATPTGAARVLKMTFKVVVTERAGLGIAWDEEQPPVYEDVPPSPPHYAGVLPYCGPPLDEPPEGLSLGMVPVGTVGRGREEDPLVEMMRGRGCLGAGAEAEEGDGGASRRMASADL
ncbi:MAG: hypothetical protein Q9165_005377 [Trypethelium subeluteriae]